MTSSTAIKPFLSINHRSKFCFLGRVEVVSFPRFFSTSPSALELFSAARHYPFRPRCLWCHCDDVKCGVVRAGSSRNCPVFVQAVSSSSASLSPIDSWVTSCLALNVEFVKASCERITNYERPCSCPDCAPREPQESFVCFPPTHPLEQRFRASRLVWSVGPWQKQKKNKERNKNKIKPVKNKSDV